MVKEEAAVVVVALAVVEAVAALARVALAVVVRVAMAEEPGVERRVAVVAGEARAPHPGTHPA